MVLLLFLIILIILCILSFGYKKYQISENFKLDNISSMSKVDEKSYVNPNIFNNIPICNICRDCNSVFCEGCQSIFNCKNTEDKKKPFKLKYKDFKKDSRGNISKSIWDKYYKKKTGIPFSKIDKDGNNNIEKKEWKLVKKDLHIYNNNSKFDCGNNISSLKPFECGNMAIFNVKDSIMTKNCLMCESQKCGLCTTSSGLQVCMPYYINSLGKPIQKYKFISCNPLKTNTIAPWLTKPKAWLTGFPESQNYNAELALDKLTNQTLYKSFKERINERNMSKEIKKFNKTHKYTVSQLNRHKKIKTKNKAEEGPIQQRWVLDSRPGPFTKGELQVPWE